MPQSQEIYMIGVTENILELAVTGNRTAYKVERDSRTHKVEHMG